MQNLSISQKIAAAFGAVLLIFATASFIAFVSLRMAQSAVDRQTQIASAEQSLDVLLRAMVEQQNHYRGYAITHKPDMKKSFNEVGRGQANQMRANLTASIATKIDSEDMSSLFAAVDTFQKSADEMVALGDANVELAVMADKFVTAARLTEVRKHYKALRASLEDSKQKAVADSDAALQTVNLAIIIGGLLALGVAALAGILLSREIAGPIVSMTALMERLARGDDALAIPATGRRDEIGRMAGTLEVFRQASVDKNRAEREVEQNRATQEALQNEAAAERAARAQAQVQIMEKLAEALERLASGDLTYTIDAAFPGDYERLRADFNDAVRALRAVMAEVVAGGGALHDAAAEICSSSDDFSRRIERQAASLEETAAALDEITVSVHKASQGALSAARTVSATRAEAERSGEVVVQAVAAMSRIENSSREITQIIGVIDEIAFQTNLLALNAGVEAARAGDAGRGFAVVAQEVRALAQRSADAAKEIKILIANSGDEVSSGVRLVAETGEALQGIIAKVSEINSVVEEIAASSKEQATGLSEINQAINQMDQTTQQNAAMFDETIAVSHRMADQSEGLVDRLKQFRIGAGREQMHRAA
jgi:methyl-accepting chemotaxis protein